MSDGNPTKKGINYWSREELLLVFDLYCRIPFSKTKRNNPAVIALANLIGRSPSSVALKLGNFGSFDPELRTQGIGGLPHVGRLDREIWDEFNSSPDQLVWEADQIRRRYSSHDQTDDLIEPSEDEVFVMPSGPSEREAIRKYRVHQSFFRDAILTGYNETCCITGLRIKECLIASHIVPWKDDETHRTDPRNGLCLSATFDKLFDRGLITVSSELNVVVSESIRKTDEPLIDEMIGKYHGKPIIPPQRFYPDPRFLLWHQTKIFRDK